MRQTKTLKSMGHQKTTKRHVPRDWSRRLALLSQDADRAGYHMAADHLAYLAALAGREAAEGILETT